MRKVDKLPKSAPESKLLRKCRLASCGAAFPVPPAIPHKEFCCEGHRHQYWTEKRKAAMAAMREAEGNGDG